MYTGYLATVASLLFPEVFKQQKVNNVTTIQN